MILYTQNKSPYSTPNYGAAFILHALHDAFEQRQAAKGVYSITPHTYSPENWRKK